MMIYKEYTVELINVTYSLLIFIGVPRREYLRPLGMPSPLNSSLHISIFEAVSLVELSLLQ